MLVNPILLIFGLFLLGVVICFYIVRRPTRPYLSGVCLILLALFLECEASFRVYQSIDIGLVTATLVSIGYDIWNSLLRSSRPEEEP